MTKTRMLSTKFIWQNHSNWSPAALTEGGIQSTSIGNSFSCETISWVWMWNLARPSSNLFNWNTMSWKCLLSRSSNFTKTSDLSAANCFLARERHLRTNLKKRGNIIIFSVTHIFGTIPKCRPWRVMWAPNIRFKGRIYLNPTVLNHEQLSVGVVLGKAFLHPFASCTQ